MSRSCVTCRSLQARPVFHALREPGSFLRIVILRAPYKYRRFDVPVRELDCRRGEFLIDHMDAVEDTKVSLQWFGRS